LDAITERQLLMINIRKEGILMVVAVAMAVMERNIVWETGYNTDANALGVIEMVKVYRCKKCNTILPDETHLKVHEGVHKHAKSRITEYGDPEFSKDKLR
jgi:hypothetical protein